MDVISHRINISTPGLQALLLSSIGISLLLLVLGIYLDMTYLGAIFPIACFSLFLVVFHPVWIFILLFAVIPLSSEFELSNGLSTDIPGEPLLWITTVMTILYLITTKVPHRLLYPIGFIIAIQLLWLAITALFAEQPMLSVKYSIAKIWYVLPFFVLPFYIIKNRSDLHKLFDAYLIGLLIASLYFFLSHAQVDFDFLAKTEVGKPIWRNHVNYACSLVISFPIAVYRHQTCLNHRTWRYKILLAAILVFMCFSYARVVYLCLGTAAIYVFVLRYKLTKIAIVISLLTLSWIAYYQINQANYIRYAPEYSSTIMQESFDKKIKATLNGKDISTMERLHRWVAGLHMIEQNPFTGVGPSNFYSSYKKYAVHSFETYVSDNPEKSGIHNYYLMTAVEQGIPGLLLLLTLVITNMIYIENSYHRINSHYGKQLLLLSGTCLIIILSLNSINDMLEVIKVGGLFYFMLFISLSASNPLFLRVKREDIGRSVIF
ncbi:MAG: O-antigen ligase [Saprospiraceae bacterium]|jgi:O-antigen ligase